MAGDHIGLHQRASFRPFINADSILGLKHLNESALSTVSQKVLKAERREMMAYHRIAAGKPDSSGFRPQRSAVQTSEQRCASMVFSFYSIIDTKFENT